MITTHKNPAYGSFSPITKPTGLLSTKQALKAILKACNDNDMQLVNHLETRKDICNAIVKIGHAKWEQIKLKQRTK